MVPWWLLLMGVFIGGVLGVMLGAAIANIAMEAVYESEPSEKAIPESKNKHDNGSIYPYTSPAQRILAGKLKIPAGRT